MKMWQKMLTASLACSVIFSVSEPAQAAYSLNPEVKQATPALLTASQIGVLQYENPNFSSRASKDAILVMSF